MYDTISKGASTQKQQNETEPEQDIFSNALWWSSNMIKLDQGLSKHQEVSSTPVTKVTKFTVVFWTFLVQ